ncbi:hypothetical protein BH09SUM1_BH09SUM1_34340 [soil metagenome]
MKTSAIIGPIVLLVIGGGAIAYMLNKKADAENRQRAAAAATAVQSAAGLATPAPAQSPIEAALAAYPNDPVKFGDELAAKASVLWKEGNKGGSIAAADAALEIYDKYLGKQHDKTVTLRVNSTKAKMEMLMPNGKSSP